MAADQLRFPYQATWEAWGKGVTIGQRKTSLLCQWCPPTMGQWHELLATAVCIYFLSTQAKLCDRNRGATQRCNVNILQRSREEECPLQVWLLVGQPVLDTGSPENVGAMLSQFMYMIFKNYFMFYSACEYVQVSLELREIGFPDARAKGICEISQVGAGNWTCVLHKINRS